MIRNYKMRLPYTRKKKKKRNSPFMHLSVCTLFLKRVYTNEEPRGREERKGVQHIRLHFSNRKNRSIKRSIAPKRVINFSNEEGRGKKKEKRYI